jgi:hypothetical protein
MFTMYDKQGRLVLKWSEAPVQEGKVVTVRVAKPRDEAKTSPEPLRDAA